MLDTPLAEVPLVSLDQARDDPDGFAQAFGESFARFGFAMVKDHGVPRVHGLVSRKTWSARYGQINDFEAKYPSTLGMVKGDVALGRQLGVKSTPTFFINGVKIEGALPPQYFDQAIAYELQRASK